MHVFKKMLANDISSWECILRRKGAHCKASIKLSILDEFTGQNNEHTHPPSQTLVEVTKATASIKRKAEATEETSQQILATELRNISEGAAANLPSLDVLKETSAMCVRRVTCCQFLRLVRKSQCFPKNIN